jgi:hypothetical protein
MRLVNLEVPERLLNRMSLEHLWNLLFLEVPERRCQAHPDILVNLWNQSFPEVLLNLENQLNPVDQWNQLNLGHHLNQRYLENQSLPEVLLILEHHSNQLNPVDLWNQSLPEVLLILENQRNPEHHLNQLNPEVLEFLGQTYQFHMSNHQMTYIDKVFHNLGLKEIMFLQQDQILHLLAGPHLMLQVFPHRSYILWK